MSTTISRYAGRGVSSSKEDVHAAIRHIDKGLYPKAFCKIIPDTLSGDPEACLVMHADGAGTKSALAYAYWRETGDASVWKGIAQDAIVMNTDDLLCVGVTGNVLLSSTIGRNKHLIPGEVVSAVINGTEEFLQKMRDQGFEIRSTGGETADVGDLVRTIIVDSTVTARLRRSDVIDNAHIGPGCAIVGLASFGQASYEDEYNGGMGSNGLTSARHDVFARILAEKYPETYDPETPSDLVYSGKYRLTDTVPGCPLTVGKLVLSPTRTYAPVVRAILDEHRGDIRGMVHWQRRRTDQNPALRRPAPHNQGQSVRYPAAVPADPAGVADPLARDVQRIQHGAPHGDLRGPGGRPTTSSASRKVSVSTPG